MKNLYDAVIVGGGPAGLTAAIYLARARCRVLVLEKEQFGGQISITDEVVNYPGIEKISGRSLAERMKTQAESFGAEFLSAEALSFDFSGDIKLTKTDKGEFHSFGVLLAVGAHPKQVGFKGEDEHKGHGVAYCATCDGEFFTDKDIFVIGGGFAAAEEGVFLTKYARHVTILVRKNDFSCAASVSDKAKNHPKITVLTNTVMEEVSGENGLDYARYKNTVTGEVTEFRAKGNDSFGVFVFAGYSPATERLKDMISLSDEGYILTDSAQKTDIDGVYAAGDVCKKPLRQVVTAVGEGALAATELEKHAEAMRQKTGLTATAPAVKKSVSEKEKASDDSEEIFSGDILRQLETLFSRMENPLILKLHLDESELSAELDRFITELAARTDKLTVSAEQGGENTPFVSVCYSDGAESGLAFHGVPAGHEFTSFILGLYNAAGSGQPIDGQLKKRILAIKKPVEIKVLITLSCMICPDLVIAAQKIAAMNPLVTTHVYDIRHFEKLKEKYRVMSVPCLVVNDDRQFFGKKNIEELLNIISE